MSADLKELKRLADAATQGAWNVKRFGVVTAGPLQEKTKGMAQNQILMATGADWMREGEAQANAEYCSAANPETILALLAQLEQAKADAERWQYYSDMLSKKTGHSIEQINGTVDTALQSQQTEVNK